MASGKGRAPAVTQRADASKKELRTPNSKLFGKKCFLVPSFDAAAKPLPKPSPNCNEETRHEDSHAVPPDSNSCGSVQLTKCENKLVTEQTS